MRGVVAMFVVGVVGALTVAPASGQANKSPKQLCFRGRPAAACRAFWLTEVGRYMRFGGSSFVESGRVGSFEVTHLSTHLTWELGGMVNRSPATAVGATALIGGDGRGTRLGLKGRYRRWLGPGEGTLDVSGGVLKAVVAGSYPDFSRESYGATADVSLGWRDFVAGTVQADLLRTRNGEMVNAVYGGVRVGSYPAVIGTVAGAIVVGVLIALIFGGGDF